MLCTGFTLKIGCGTTQSLLLFYTYLLPVLVSGLCVTVYSLVVYFVVAFNFGFNPLDYYADLEQNREIREKSHPTFSKFSTEKQIRCV